MAINNSDVAMGTIALTIKRKDLYVEAAEGGGAERGSEREKERGEDAERTRKCEKIGARGAKVLSSSLFMCERASVCIVHLHV